ncbi:MAG: S-layer homology domain-containing protein, partial [Oscillospiraceae bacterium]|nr:S-layer homology domain-containing protein [Oscillospiraceae bacterium]
MRKIALAVMIVAVVLACMGVAAVDVDEVRDVGSPEDARRVFRGALEGLSGVEKGDPGVVEELALLAEECVRYAGGEAPGGTVLDMMDSAAMYGVEFVRKLRVGATVRVGDGADGEAVVEVEGRELSEAAGEQYDYVCIEAPFARLRLDARDAAGRGDVAMRDLRVPPEPEKPAAIAAALRYWSVWAILVSLVVSIAIEPLRRKAFTRWITLALCLALAGGNALSLALTREETFVADDGVEISIAEGAPFILSLPARDEYEAELTVVDADGKPLPCKYNSLTHTVDARVNAGGKYYLRLSAVYFTDIADKSDEMRRAVRVLTSCGLMDGADERSFLPDREITRAEFASVMLRVMGLLDESAESRFTDVLHSDWFYAVAASAEKEG